MLTGREQGVFRLLLEKAWRAHCTKAHQDPKSKDAREAWYRAELVASVGVYTTKQIKTAEGFDRLCLHFATLSGEQEQIDYWTRAPERRALWWLEQEMEKTGKDWDYVYGIARKMNFPDRHIEDLPEELIRKLAIALYKARKREEKKARA